MSPPPMQQPQHQNGVRHTGVTDGRAEGQPSVTLHPDTSSSSDPAIGHETISSLTDPPNLQERPAHGPKPPPQLAGVEAPGPHQLVSGVALPELRNDPTLARKSKVSALAVDGAEESASKPSSKASTFDANPQVATPAAAEECLQGIGAQYVDGSTPFPQQAGPTLANLPQRAVDKSNLLQWWLYHPERPAAYRQHEE